MLQRNSVEYYVYLAKSASEKIFLSSILTDSPHKARQIVWAKFEPDIKNKRADAKINHLIVEPVNDQIMVK